MLRKRLWIALPAILLAACASTTGASTLRPPASEYPPTIFRAVSYSPASKSRLDDTRPNIIVILTDDQPYQTVDYMPTVRNVLEAQGVNFANGFMTTPLCCPSRASILSGLYAHNHQVLTDRWPMGGARKFDDSRSFAIWLHAAGYETAYYGKYLNGYEDLTPAGYVPPGWDQWGAFMTANSGPEDKGNDRYYFRFSLSENGKVVAYSSKASFSADVLTQDAVNFIASARDKPFFLMIGYYNPHSPSLFAPRHGNTFRNPSEWIPWRPPDFNEPDISKKPVYIAQLHPFSESEIDANYKKILRSLLSVDDGVASILNALDQTGLRQKTVIVYLTDNGMTVGDHRFGFMKNCPYEPCIRTPFLVYAPGLYPARVDTHMVANIDLAPTFAQLAGAQVPSKVDGMSLVPLLQDAAAPWRDALLLEHWPTEEGVGSMIPAFSAVRTDRWKYVQYSTGEKELYDLRADPYELHNLAGYAMYQDIISQLAARLAILKRQ
ncbi:MAG TPA: sulfatase [Anaerolineales bacterium]